MNNETAITPDTAPGPRLNSHILAEMNERYCVVKDGGKVRVMTFDRHSQQVGQATYVRSVPVFLSFADFLNLTMNQSINMGNRQMPQGKWWLEQTDRRQYDGLIFQPGGESVIDNKMNLWRGWGIEPKAGGDWGLMREHIRAVMTRDAEMFDYAINWLAWAVQHPDQRAEVALVFRGGKGAGKGTLGNAMMTIFGQHAVHISHAKHLTGFNGHLRAASFLFADEAYWPGDKAAEGNLKRLISEPSLLIEGKGKDAVSVENMLHVLMASNEDWIVPASERERRYVLNEVSGDKMQDAAWFEPIYTQMENGGHAAMLHDLLERDLGDWHPRRIPANAGLADQQARSLSDLDTWWLELLETGSLAGCDPENPNCARSGDYEEKSIGGLVVAAETNGDYPRFVTRPGLFTAARKIVPHLGNHTTAHAFGAYLTKQGCIVRERKRVLRKSGWEFPALLDCRRAWVERFPDTAWRDPDLTEWRAENDADVIDDPMARARKQLADQGYQASKANTLF